MRTLGAIAAWAALMLILLVTALPLLCLLAWMAE